MADSSTGSDPVGPDPRLFVALDLPSVEEALAVVDALDGAATSFKVGLQLLPIGGAELCRELKRRGHTVFADFKFHDIGATVEKATRSVAQGLGVDFITVHARPQVLEAAVRGAEGSSLKVLGVSVLTSLGADELRQTGHTLAPEALVDARARQVAEAGAHGVVASPLEAARVRAIVGPDLAVVTPGVRPRGAARGDQKRVATPREAIRAGASHIVVGRPITQSSDPRAAALRIAKELAEARPL